MYCICPTPTTTPTTIQRHQLHSYDDIKLDFPSGMNINKSVSVDFLYYITLYTMLLYGCYICDSTIRWVIVDMPV